MEDALHEHINHMTLGARLHRHVAMGSKVEDPDVDEDSYLCKTFVTFAPLSVIRDKGLCTINL